jgi:DNA-binding SARP family transcriptional activator
LRDGCDGAGVRVYLAGPVCVEAGDVLVTERSLPGPQGRLLLAVLAAEHARPLGREQLADVLWRDRPPAWHVALRALVSRLRGALAVAGVPVRHAFGAYHLGLPGEGWVDVHAALASGHEADAALDAGDPARAASSALVARLITARPFVPGAEGPWAEGWRRRLADLRLRALEAGGAAHLALGAFAAAAEDAELALALDPVRESAWRLLMRAHAGAGNVASALAAYGRCCAALADRLAVAPSPPTRAVHAELLASAG